MAQPSAPRRSRTFGIAALLLVNVFWGLSFIASKYALTAGFPPMTLATLRYLFAALVLTPLALRKPNGLRLERRDIPMAVFSSALGITLYYYLEYTGMMYTTASTASLILAAIPVFSLLYGVLFQRQRASGRQWLNVGLSLLGVFLIIGVDALGAGAGSLRGNLMIVGCCLSWVGYIQTSARLRATYPSLKLTAWQALFALATLIPFALAERSRWVPVDALAWACAVGLALICSALCYFLYAEALSAVDPFTASLFININPIAAVLGGALLLGERMAAAQWVGGALILGSLLLNSRHARTDKAKA